MLVYSDILTVLCQYFPDDTLATGRRCSQEIIEMINSENAADNAPTINVVNDVNVTKVATEGAMIRIADIIVNSDPLRKISCIKDFRFAFPNESLKSSKDAIEAAYRRNGYDLSGRKFNVEQPTAVLTEEPLADWERELLHGNPWESRPTRNPDPINRPHDDESDRF